MTTMKQFKLFWAWDDEKEEVWLREMSQKGWHFKSVSLPGNYIFEQGEPTDYVYRLDYFTNRKDMVEYLQIFDDAGWAYMGEMNRWQYFRQEVTQGEAPEIFTDNASKAKKYQQIMFFVAILFFPIFLYTILIINQGVDSGIPQVFVFIMSILLLPYIYIMMRLLRRIIELSK